MCFYPALVVNRLCVMTQRLAAPMSWAAWHGA